MQKIIWFCLNLRLLSFAKKKIPLIKKKPLLVNYPFPLTDLQQNQQTDVYKRQPNDLSIEFPLLIGGRGWREHAFFKRNRKTTIRASLMPEIGMTAPENVVSAVLRGEDAGNE